MRTIQKAAKISLATVLAWMVAGIASAQTTTTDIITSTTTGTIGTTTPGIPNTGVGGDVVTNVLLLAASAAIALIGLAYLSSRWARE
jgi:hypothetical protein